MFNNLLDIQNVFYMILPHVGECYCISRHYIRKWGTRKITWCWNEIMSKQQHVNIKGCMLNTFWIIRSLFIGNSYLPIFHHKLLLFVWFVCDWLRLFTVFFSAMKFPFTSWTINFPVQLDWPRVDWLMVSGWDSFYSCISSHA